MKNLNKILLIAAFAAIVGAVGQARAQYQPLGADGIAASPKLRQVLDQRQMATTGTAYAPAPYRVAASDGITASPKLREQLNAMKPAPAGSSEGVASTGYNSSGADGITASPKLRQQINDRGLNFTIAPLK